MSALQEIDWSDTAAGDLRLHQAEGGKGRASQMPFEITIYENGLAVFDLCLRKDKWVPIAEWGEQRLTAHPINLTCTEVIRAVADKGGGAHVDANASIVLRYIHQRTPADRTFAELFILGMGRFIQALGEHLFRYQGARIPQALTIAPQQKLNLVLAAHEEYVRALEQKSDPQNC